MENNTKSNPLRDLTPLDKAIYEAVKEAEEGAKFIDAREALKNLRKKYFEQ